MCVATLNWTLFTDTASYLGYVMLIITIGRRLFSQAELLLHLHVVKTISLLRFPSNSLGVLSSRKATNFVCLR
jgi:hypothetical protein